MNRPGLDYSFQVEWIRGRGLRLWLAMVFGSIGGGAFLVSAVVGFLPGCLAGFLVATIGKGVLHIAFLGRPERFWRAMLRPKSSWISRGIFVLGLFGIVALVYVILLSAGVTGGVVEVLRLLAIVLAALLITYDGFLMAAAPGVPFWNSAVLPVLYGAAALLSGVGFAMAFLPYVIAPAEPTLHQIEALERYLLPSLAFLILSYLWTMYYTSSGARQSVRETLVGRVRTPFLLMLLSAIVVPAAVSLVGLFVTLPYPLVSVSAVIAIGGDFALKYTVLRAGVYAPLLPRFVAAGSSARL